MTTKEIRISVDVVERSDERGPVVTPYPHAPVENASDETVERLLTDIETAIDKARASK